ncbi:flagellar hook-length control protein FliK [Thiosulfativibrio zosterae]|uniref:Flagellar hook-length control protein-like C-terminal domain-containing protein n=1 Tax=Thiosulfativibrio zosterae TaxID=2675053 RepID=A0A6F8PM65_9GAMM|nr:flagellar hook-length control protein FliK [Thiosulfativibrio zosterae]BBP43137.1 hypothetical protein THMIRHAT_08830 [Thiosulfativibrio zosterae]
MLETQKTPQPQVAPFMVASPKSTDRQALPTEAGSSPFFAGLMASMAREDSPAAGTTNLLAQNTAETSMPGFANLASSSDLVLAQLGVKPVNAEAGTLAEAALKSLEMPKIQPGLVNLESDLANNLTAAVPAMPVETLTAETQSLPQELVSLSDVPSDDLLVEVPAAELAQASVLPVVAEAGQVTEEVSKLSGESTLKEVGDPGLVNSLSSNKASPGFGQANTQTAAGSSPSVQSMTAKAEQKVEGVNPQVSAAAQASVGNEKLTSETSEKLPAGFDKIAAKPEKSEGSTTWGTQSQQAATVTAQAMQTSSQGQSNQQGQNHQSQQQQLAQMQFQAQQSVEQSVKSRFTEEMNAAKSAESSEKDRSANVLGDLGNAFDKRAQLPLGLQSINTPVRHPQWGQALGQRVVVMANQKIQEAKITLNPEKLGPVQIKLHMDKDQQVHVSMLAQHGTTREAMENAIPKLKEMLEQAGIAFGSMDVGDQRDFDQAKEESASEKGAQKSSSLSSLDDEKEDKTVLLQTKNNNLVDYYA